MSLKKHYKPWESYDQHTLQVRTYGAQEAIRRAQKIVERNSEFSKKINEKYCIQDNDNESKKTTSLLSKIITTLFLIKEKLS